MKRALYKFGIIIISGLISSNLYMAGIKDNHTGGVTSESEDENHSQFNSMC